MERTEGTLSDIHTIHTDNGSEFHALFDRAVAELQLLHRWSPPRAPKIHSHIERFNGVFYQEFIDYHIDGAIVDQPTFVTDLSSWLTRYNTKRPHLALNLMSPVQYFHYLQKGAGSLKCP